MFSTDVYDTFRPSDETLSPREKSQVQTHRVLCLLGLVLGLLFIPVYSITNPEATDPIWLRVINLVLLAGFWVASYWSEHIRRNAGFWSRVAISLFTGWFLLLTMQNGFASDYEIGLLLLHAIFTVTVGIGAQTIAPVLLYSLFSLAATAGAVLISPAAFVEEAVLLSAMVTASLVIGVVMKRLIMVREKVADKEVRLRGLANSVPGIVFQFYARPNGAIGPHFVSEHVEDVLGISSDPDDFLQRVNECIPHSHRDRVRCSVEEAIDEDRTWRVEFPFERPSGERIWLLGTAAPETRNEEMIYNGFLLDITGRKRAEHALRQSKEEAEEASRLKTAMLANMSHEVRTPLTSIIGFSEVLKDRLAGDLQALAQRVHQGSKRLLDTLESVLQLSRLEAGAARLEREDVALKPVCEDIIALLEPRAESKSIPVETVWPNESVVGCWNRNAVRRIVRNLLENAIKFTPEGGCVELRVGREAQHAILEVEDTGIGINDDRISDIFRAFRQESEGIRREYQGSGLGLSIVDHLVQEFGGRVEVETEKNKGTCFAVRLPLQAKDQISAASEADLTDAVR